MSGRMPLARIPTACRAICLGGGLGVLAGGVVAWMSVLEPERYLSLGLYWLAARALSRCAVQGLVVGWVVGLACALPLLFRGRHRAESSRWDQVLGSGLASLTAVAAAWWLVGWGSIGAAVAGCAAAGLAGLGLVSLVHRTRTRAVWGVALAALALLGWAGERQLRPHPQGPNLLLVSIDTLRADRLGCYGYRDGHTPNIDEIARQGTLWEVAIASSPVTLTAMSSVMTGEDPQTHGARYNGFYELRRDVVTLAELLADRGYETAAVVGNFALDSRFRIDQGFASYEDRMTQRMRPGGPPAGVDLTRATWWTRHILSRPAQRFADEITSDGLDWLGRAGDRPFFLWLHYMDPHKPYAAPPQYQREDPYDGELAFVDAEIGRFFEGYRERFPEADTLVVIVADHGESLGEHGVQGHVFAVYEQMLRIPFIMRRAGVLEAGRQIAEPIGSQDIAAEILSAIGIERPSGTFGDASPAGESRRWIFSETYEPYINRDEQPLRSVRGKRWKFIRQGTEKEELYDLGSDPGEIRNLLREDPERAASLRRVLESAAGPTHPEPRSVDADTLQRLKDLGYVN